MPPACNERQLLHQTTSARPRQAQSEQENSSSGQGKDSKSSFEILDSMVTSTAFGNHGALLPEDESDGLPVLSSTGKKSAPERFHGTAQGRVLTADIAFLGIGTKEGCETNIRGGSEGLELTSGYGFKAPDRYSCCRMDNERFRSVCTV